MQKGLHRLFLPFVEGGGWQGFFILQCFLPFSATPCVIFVSAALPASMAAWQQGPARPGACTVWSPLCTQSYFPLGCEQRIFHNNHKTQTLIPTNPFKESRDPQAIPNEKLLPKECSERSPPYRREAGVFRFIRNSNQGREEVKIPLFSSQSLSWLAHSAAEIWGSKKEQKELWTRHQEAWVPALLRRWHSDSLQIRSYSLYSHCLGKHHGHSGCSYVCAFSFRAPQPCILLI